MSPYSSGRPKKYNPFTGKGHEPPKAPASTGCAAKPSMRWTNANDSRSSGIGLLEIEFTLRHTEHKIILEPGRFSRNDSIPLEHRPQIGKISTLPHLYVPPCPKGTLK